MVYELTEGERELRRRIASGKNNQKRRVYRIMICGEE